MEITGSNITFSKIRMVTIISLILFMSIWLAASERFITTLGMDAPIDIENPNKVNIKVHLEATEISTETNTRTLREATETGKVSPEDVKSRYTTHPLNEQKINVYFVNVGGQVEDLCELTTDENGDAKCSRILETQGTGDTEKCGLIIANFSETKEYAKSSAIPRKHCRIGIPPFTNIVGPEWLVLFLFIGVLAAGLYASGRKPGAAFDVTTPELKGPASGKAKSSIPVRKGIFGAAVPFAYSKIILIRNKRRLSQNLEAAKKVIKKHGTPKMIAELKGSKRVSAEKMVKLVSNMMIGGGAYGRSGGLYGHLKSKLSIKEKERKRLLTLSKTKTGEAIVKIRASLTDLDKSIEIYKKDLLAVSPAALMPGENFIDVNPEAYKETVSSIKASFIGFVLGDKGSLGKGYLSDSIDRNAAGFVDEMKLGNKGEVIGDYPAMRESLIDIFALKSEMQRTRLVVYGRIIERLKEKKLNHTKEYIGLFKKKKPMEETGKDLLALMKKLDNKEYENLLNVLKNIEEADISIVRTEKKFLDSLAKIRKVNELIQKGMKDGMIGSRLEELKRKLEEATENAGMAYLILKKRAKGYREAIEENIVKNKLSPKIRKEDMEELGEILVNDAFKDNKENKKKVVEVLIKSYLTQRRISEGTIIAERFLVERGNDIVYVNEEENQKIKVLDMLEKERSDNLRKGKTDLVRKLERTIKEIRSKRESK